ncbi:DUF6544 family protein [Gemmatirosa kalamazoonensis]|nr:DUF6544 family protein [Gemmatirosa kalamazoonensis]
MRLALAFLLALHGAIHLLGAAKGLGLADVAQLRQPIGPRAGALWLAAGLLLLAGAALVALGARAWWAPALAGVVLSQALVVATWADAKWGTVANLVALVPLLVVLLDFRAGSLRSTYRRDVRAALASGPRAAPVVTERDLAPLPPLVQRYLRRAGVVGRPRVRSVHAEFAMDIRGGPDEPWMHARADQVELFAPNARLFFMRASRRGVPVDVLHRYVGDRATMEARVAGIVPVTQLGGRAMTRSETVTLLNDLCVFAPAALVDAPVTWTPVEDDRVRATFTNAGETVSAVLAFDASGDLVDFRSDDRLRADGVTMRTATWTTPLRDYREFGGARLASRGEARWTEGGRTWTYGRLVLERVAYNVAPSGATP